MLFSDFIKDSLLGKNNIVWNYYPYADINTDDILHADTSAEFIRTYFENGEKELPLLLNPEHAAAFLKDYFLAARKDRLLFFNFDRQYVLSPERAIHTVSGFFLGLLIENCLNAENPLSIERPEHFPFSYLWFLTFLYHDYGYCVVERDDSPIITPTNDGLAALVKRQFALDPVENCLFLFCGRRRDRIKALYWEGNGFLLLYKRLESGVFQWPRKESEARALTTQQYR